MITILSLPDAERFLSVVGQTSGDVSLRLPDGGQISLKRDQTARRMLQLLKGERTHLQITLSDQADMPLFLRYLAEAGRCA